ncbi:MAG TPA: phospholipid ABC transporter ATP-binding protein MlaF, partial [Acinetobacter ursingii]|nr:phospholipid ABC transporter ATP-binding protein MlaF [Acinetobacter ursingii]
MNNSILSTAQPLIEVKNLSFNRGERVIYDNVD